MYWNEMGKPSASADGVPKGARPNMRPHIDENMRPISLPACAMAIGTRIEPVTRCPHTSFYLFNSYANHSNSNMEFRSLAR